MRPPHDRLNGWKEVAAHLGKGVRTVQRWERQYGLPVHRLGDQVEVVFAFRSEIDAWAERRQAAPARADTGSPSAAEQAGTAPAKSASEPVAVASPAAGGRRSLSTLMRSWWAVGLVAIAAMVAVAWLAVPSRPLGATTANPADWDLTDDTLRVFGEDRTVLWTHHFRTPLAATLQAAPPEEQPVHIGDFDGDGRREVIAGPVSLDGSQSPLLWFDGTGRLVSSRKPTDTVHFGADVFAPPWIRRWIWVTDGGGGRRSVWVGFIHSVWYPTVLEEFGTDARLRSRYWSNGYIGWVGTSTWRGRRVALVGGTNNESGGGSLAILPPDWTAGSAPAETAKYRCADCPQALPLEFLVFPRSCVLAGEKRTADVLRADVDALGRLVVSVNQIAFPSKYQVKYTLDANLTEARVWATPELVTEHDRRWRAGELDHAFGDRDLAQMLPVKRWVSGRFEALAVARD